MIKANKLLLFFLLMLISAILKAQPFEPAPTGMFYFRNLDVSDGLTSNAVTAIHEDSRGFIWIGTEDGLVRFDGVNFRSFLHDPENPNSIAHNHVALDVLEDDRNRLWITLYGRGFSRYDMRTDLFNSFTFANGKFPEKWMDHIQNFMFADNRTTYINCVDGILKVDSADNITVLSSVRSQSNLSELGQLREAELYNNRWIWTTTKKGIACYDILENHWEFQEQNPRGLDIFKGHWVIHSAVHEGGNIYFSTFYPPKENGKRFLYSYNVENDVLDSVVIAPDLARSHPYSDLCNDILVHSDGSIWLATEGLGLLKYQPSTVEKMEAWTQFSGSLDWIGNLPPGPLTVLHEDRAGKLWIGSQRGISLMAPQRQYFKNHAHVTTNLGETVALTGIKTLAMGSEGDIWLGQLSKGLIHLNKNRKFLERISTLDHPKTKNSGYIEPLLFTADTLLCHVWYSGLRGYCMTTRGIVPINKYTDRNQPELREIFKHSNGNLYAWGWERFGKLNAATGNLVTMLPPENPAGRADLVMDATEDEKGNIWLGMANTGIICVNPNSLKIIENWQRDTTRFPTTSVWNIIFKNGKLYFSLDEDGLGILDLKTKEIQTFSKSDGLCSDAINGILLDAKNEVWIYSSSGISWFDEENKRFRTFTGSDGMLSQDISDAKLLSNGNILMISDLGLIEFNPADLKTESTAKRPTLLSIKVYDSPKNIYNVLRDSSSVTVPYNENHLRVEFSALEFFDPEKIQFAYRLQGAEQNWNYTNRQPVAIYTNMKGGRYNLCVKQTNLDGVWGPELCIPIFVTTAIYRQAWFIILLLIIALLSGYRIYRWQLKKRLAVLEVRNQLSRDLHDDIGSALSSINIYSTIAQDQLGENLAETGKLLQHISSGADQMMQDMDDIVWAIHPGNDEVNHLIRRMREFAVPILEAKDISLNIEANDSIKPLKISMEKRRDLFLIFKEAINNMAKYSEANTATASIKTEGKMLIMTISDNGKGFDSGMNTDRYGLKNMKKRAEEMGGNAQIHSEAGKGTTVWVEVSLG